MSDSPPPHIPTLLKPLELIFNQAIKEYGPNHKAVAWKNEERQQRRFQIFAGLLSGVSGKDDYIINDLGCGYGAMFEAFKDLSELRKGRYIGYDISDEMVRTAKKRIPDSRTTFIQSYYATEEADFSFVSGTYNMKLHQRNHIWRDYVEENLKQLWSKTRAGLGFNMLSIQNPDREKTLFYADPEYFYAFCRTNLSEKIRLVNRLEPEEFVILIMR